MWDWRKKLYASPKCCINSSVLPRKRKITNSFPPSSHLATLHECLRLSPPVRKKKTSQLCIVFPNISEQTYETNQKLLNLEPKLWFLQHIDFKFYFTIAAEAQGFQNSHPEPKSDPNVFSTFIFPLKRPWFLKGTWEQK